MELEEKAGQVLCLGWQGATDAEAQTVNPHARALVEELGAGGIVLLRRNIGPLPRCRETLTELQALSRAPLFIAVDQEGGLVNRFGAPFPTFPGNMALGAVQPPEEAEALAYRQSQWVAEALRGVGVNWNFAPVVDVNNNPDNPVIGIRSFGETPERVGRLGAASVRGTQESGVLACAKHFPGHGDTAVDSHLALPTVPHSRQRMETVELVPFRAVIAAGVGAIMTSHVLFPALDPDRPATLSPAVLTGLLREELGYEGLVISDCLEMEAIASTVGTVQGAVETLRAGADMALICHSLSRQREAKAALIAAVQSGYLPLSRLDEAVERIQIARRRFILPPAFPAEQTVATRTGSLLEQRIARRAITLVRSAEAGLPHLTSDSRLAVLSAHRCLLELAARLATEAKTAVPGMTITPFPMPPDFPNEIVQKTLESVRNEASVVLVATAPNSGTGSPLNRQAQAELVQALAERFGSRLLVVALREPYDLRHYPAAANCLCIYGPYAPNLAALAEALFGKIPLSGKLPVTVSDR